MHRVPPIFFSCKILPTKFARRNIFRSKQENTRSECVFFLLLVEKIAISSQLSSLGKTVNAKADFDQYLNSIASKKCTGVAISVQQGFEIQHTEDRKLKLTHCLLWQCICLVTTPNEPATGAQKGAAATSHTMTALLSLKKIDVSGSNSLFHTENGFKIHYYTNIMP